MMRFIISRLKIHIFRLEMHILRLEIYISRLEMQMFPEPACFLSASQAATLRRREQGNCHSDRIY